LSILAYAAFALSFVLSLIFLGEERLLASTSLEHGLAFAAAGAAGAHEPVQRVGGTCFDRDRDGDGIRLGGPSHGQYWFYDPKYVVTLFVLLLYVSISGLRGPRHGGARASKLCIFNFVVVVLSFTVVNLYLSHSHRIFREVIEPRHGNVSSD